MTMLTGARQRTSRARATSSSGSRPEGIDQRRTVLIDRPRHELYRVLRDLDVLPRFLDHLAAVSVEDDQTWAFLIRDGEQEIRWRARLSEDVPGNCIAWESLPGGDLIAGGSISLSDGKRGGTVVDMELWYRPSEEHPTDPAVLRLFRKYGGRRFAQNLLELRSVIEGDVLSRIEDSPPLTLNEAASPP